MQQSLYNKDFFMWTQQQAEFIKNKQFDKLDISNLFDEVESMGISDKRQLFSRMCTLLMHLLKWQFQPDRRGTSWIKTTYTQRRDVKLLLRDSPSLKKLLEEFVADAYKDALKEAFLETKLPKSTFPQKCPWTIDQILNDEFYPDGESESV